MSFGELDHRVQRLANGFRGTLGLAKGDRVAILSKNCIQYMEVFTPALAAASLRNRLTGA